jgi:DNA-binding GntR family transcriptional regulator
MWTASDTVVGEGLEEVLLDSADATAQQPVESAYPTVADHPTIKDVIHAALRERIVSGELRPGERLVETVLASRFGVSKTPVREVLQTLEAEGLVTLRTRRGAEVTQISADEYRDLQFTRDALEFGALAWIMAAFGEVDDRTAAAQLAEMEAAYSAGDYRRYRLAERPLYRTLLGGARYRSLTEIALNLTDRMERYTRLAIAGRRDWWTADLDVHRSRVALMRAREAEGLIELIKQWHSQIHADLARQIGGA